MTDDRIRKGYQMHNIGLLYRYAGWTANGALLHAILDLFSRASRRPLSDVLNDCRSLGYPIEAVYSLLFRQVLTFDLQARPLSESTLIWSTRR